jgi:hypothetical protein
MKRIPLAEATLGELRAFADVQGLEYNSKFGADRLRAIIATAWDQPHIELVDEDEAVQPATPVKVLSGTKTRVRVVIQHEEGGIDPVFVSHNGNAIAIKRGEPVEISREHFHALELAVMQLPIKTPEGDITGWRSRHTFPFQVT